MDEATLQRIIAAAVTSAVRAERAVNANRENDNPPVAVVEKALYRLLDDVNEPKWGIYGGSGLSMTNFVDGLRVGTTREDVD